MCNCADMPDMHCTGTDRPDMPTSQVRQTRPVVEKDFYFYFYFSWRQDKTLVPWTVLLVFVSLGGL